MARVCEERDQFCEGVGKPRFGLRMHLGKLRVDQLTESCQLVQSGLVVQRSPALRDSRPPAMWVCKNPASPLIHIALCVLPPFFAGEELREHLNDLVDPPHRITMIRKHIGGSTTGCHPSLRFRGVSAGGLLSPLDQNFMKCLSWIRHSQIIARSTDHVRLMLAVTTTATTC